MKAATSFDARKRSATMPPQRSFAPSRARERRHRGESMRHRGPRGTRRTRGDRAARRSSRRRLRDRCVERFAARDTSQSEFRSPERDFSRRPRERAHRFEAPSSRSDDASPTRREQRPARPLRAAHRSVADAGTMNRPSIQAAVPFAPAAYSASAASHRPVLPEEKAGVVDQRAKGRAHGGPVCGR